MWILRTAWLYAGSQSHGYTLQRGIYYWVRGLFCSIALHIDTSGYLSQIGTFQNSATREARQLYAVRVLRI